jgi:phage baseplate assembly protein W
VNVPRSRAWLFVHPDLDSGPAEPGLHVSPAGRVEMVEGAASVRQAIVLLLTTTPGERVMRPDYGCELQRLVFSPNDETTAGLAILYVRQALARWEPRVEVLSLDATRHPDDPGRLDVVLDYRVRATGRPERLLVPLYLTGGPA